MNANWFDALSREVGRGMSRREAFGLLAKTLALTVFGSWLRPGRVQGAPSRLAQDPGCTGIRTPYRPDCPNPVPKVLYTPSVNGCGPEGGVFGTGINAVPNSPLYLADFTSPCNGHDKGYGTCNRPKDVTDRQFLHDMYGACGSEYPESGMFDSILRVQCKHAAHTYRKAVSDLGEDAYRAGQAAACDCCVPPPPCPEPFTAAPATQDHSPGLSSVAPAPAAALVCRPAQAMIVVNAKESDGRTITFRSIVIMTATPERGTNNVRSFRGKGTGPYREQFISDQCPFTITWTGEVGVEVLADVDQQEVNVDIGGPVTQAGAWPGESCLGGTYYAPNRPLPARGLSYSCRFDKVDFMRGGIYKGPPPEESPNPYGCTLNIGPLIGPTPTPGTRK